MPEPGPDDAATSSAPRRRRRKRRRSWARRRHLGLLTTGAALVVLVGGVLFVVATWDDGRDSFSQRIAAAASSAATATPTTTAPAPSATPTPSSSSTASGTSPTTVRGTITALAENSWSVTGANGLDYTVVVTATTKYGGKRTFGSFAVGDTISVKGTLDRGTVTAQSVSPTNPAS